ncbi:GNAT family N-acetyltransferase [Pelagibacterium flavum]|uniref:GNAT family N-acetyltransferase n=1 Tax=Pelagibacterium flavum TaxID=2984530 RepID=A0ABY6IM24_9HYPH|nr:GNAT family N-acetyltransferase [Pelagibacterium sp. YIM 151497]UYQ71635.1 GNAT family N-acetyltransferase [Pelagibacterium sp. YIM 151497]|tara:strand:+ start:280 stop:1473 length:1194 start_codon:yes stop_codon:yes gene_type:complete
MTAATHIGDPTTTAQPLRTLVHDSIASAAPAWLRLQEIGVYTPYQRLDWITAYIDAGFSPDPHIAIVTILDHDRPIALIPFEIVRKFGLRVARIIGMPISNGDAPVFDPHYAHLLTANALRDALANLPADIVNFHCVAAEIGNHPNPLAALGGNPAPDNFYVNTLEPGEAPFIEQSLPHKRRTNIRRSQRRLDEGFGAVILHRAKTPAEVETILEVFLDQRGRRFVQMGVENIFQRPAFRQFFRRLALEGLSENRPAISLHALYAGQTIVATSIGTYGPNHYSQYINSTDYGEASRYSLMGVTLSLLVDQLRTDGVTSLDMGLGDFDYKTDWTNRQPVFDIVLPVSTLGQIAAPLLRGARAAKRRIKQTPTLWKLARIAQSSVVGLRRTLSGQNRDH